MVTMATAITNIQSQIDELAAGSNYWTVAEIRTWINDAVRDIARRTETILTLNASLQAITGQAKYNLPADVIRVHRITFIPSGSTQEYPVQASTYDELDQLWGINPTTQSSYPDYFCVWGTPGQMTVQFYPVPAQAGNFYLFYYGMPQNLNTDGSDDTKNLRIPAGWDDAVTHYVEFRAKRKMRDATWQEAKALYDQTLGDMIAVTRQAHDNMRYIQTATSSVPSWLYEFE